MAPTFKQTAWKFRVVLASHGKPSPTVRLQPLILWSHTFHLGSLSTSLPLSQVCLREPHSHLPCPCLDCPRCPTWGPSCTARFHPSAKVTSSTPGAWSASFPTPNVTAMFFTDPESCLSHLGVSFLTGEPHFLFRFVSHVPNHSIQLHAEGVPRIQNPLVTPWPLPLGLTLPSQQRPGPNRADPDLKRRGEGHR